MTMQGFTPLPSVAGAGLVVLVVSMALVLYRIAKGPKSADRIIALDLLSMIVVAWIALFAVYARKVMYLDVAIAFSLIAFLGTVAFARYLERSVSNEQQPEDTTKGDGSD
jgi:multicomponent Na+:H+ antiporter subunit F